MKVAIAINTSWNILNFRSGIIKELIKNGHDVYTISPEDSSTKELEALGCKSHHISLENSGMNPLKDFGYYRDFVKALDTIQPDIVLSYTIKPNIYGSIACKKRNIPVINNISGLGTAFLWNKALKTLVKNLYRYAFKNSSHIFFQNIHDKNLFLEEINITETITSILPGSGVDTKHFAPVKGSKDSANFTFLMISRLLIDKGIAEYCDAAKMLKSEGHDIIFQVLGKAEEGHKRGYSKEKIESLANEGIIEYLGTTTDVRDYIASADCIVLPSYREGTARTLL
ncbi:MAG: glycosyltransferase family 4 protein, partial [Bacteroidota bacterium]